MNNDEEQKRQDQSHSSSDGGSDRYFDRKIKNMLDGASLTPPPDFFKSIEAALEKENNVQEAKDAKDLKTSTEEKRLFSLRIWRRRWSYAASISILILLSLGFWKFGLYPGNVEKPVAALVNPHTLLSEKQEPKYPAQDTAVRENISKRADLAKEKASAAASERSNQTAIAVEGENTAEKNNRGKNRTTGKKTAHITIMEPKGADNNALAAGRDHRIDLIEENRVRSNDPGQALPQKQSEKHAIARIAESAETEMPTPEIAVNVKPRTGLSAATAAKSDPASMTAATPDPDKELAITQDQGYNQEESKPRVKRGLFHGLVNHFKERVDEISNEVVAEDAQKTRIQVGCIAITAYK